MTTHRERLLGQARADHSAVARFLAHQQSLANQQADAALDQRDAAHQRAWAAQLGHAIRDLMPPT